MRPEARVRAIVCDDPRQSDETHDRTHRDAPFPAILIVEWRDLRTIIRTAGHVDGRVVRVDSFSKVVSPSIRLGCITLPRTT